MPEPQETPGVVNQPTIIGVPADGSVTATKLATNALTRGSAFTQTYSTASHTHANPTATSVVTTAATAVAPFGYAEAQANALVTAVNALIVDLANTKQVLNGLIDDLQAAPAVVS